MCREVKGGGRGESERKRAGNGNDDVEAEGKADRGGEDERRGDVKMSFSRSRKSKSATIVKFTSQKFTRLVKSAISKMRRFDTSANEHEFRLPRL